MEAQAQRDHDERLERIPILDLFLGEVVSAIRVAEACAVAEEVVTAYREGREPEEVVKSLTSQIMALKGFRRRDILNGLATLVALEDPRECEGLTAPAAQALRDYFTKREAETAAAESKQANEVMLRLFWQVRRDDVLAHDEAYYRRHQALAESFAPLIANPAKAGSVQTGVAAAKILWGVPPAAVAGPLRSWLQAFVQRHDDGKLSKAESNLLKTLFRKYESTYEPLALAAVAALKEKMLAQPG
jgi:hypothetical protein